MSVGSWRTIGITVVVLLLHSPGLASASERWEFELLVAPKLTLAKYRDTVPGDAVAFVTCRPADLIGKLGVTRNSLSMRGLASIQEDIGISPQQIERLTVVTQTADGDPVVIVTCRDKLDRDKVVKAVLTEKGEKQAEPREMYVRGEAGPAVHFVDDKTVAITQQAESLKTLLISLDQKKETSKELAAALVEADKHDVFAWSLVVRKESQKRTVSCSYYSACCGCGTPTTTGLSLAFEDCPMPEGSEAAWVSVDIGEQVKLQTHVQFEDADMRRAGAKLVRAGIDLLRAQVLMGSSMMQLNQLLPELEVMKTGAMPTTLLNHLSKALDRARVKTEATVVGVAVTIPMTGKAVRKEIEQFMQMDGARLPWADGITRSRACVRGVCDSAEPLAPPTPGIRPAIEELPQVPPPPTLPVRAPRVLVERPPADAVTVLTLTVANVRKEAAQLYRLDDKGKMVYVKQLPPGEAFDAETKRDTRWIAVFGDKQDGETFVVESEKAIWLLR